MQKGMLENNLKSRNGKTKLSNSRICWILNNPLY
ncbi:hypothetical protein LCY76_23330 [Fictibacillus sp. KIGAM418]|uniref:Recombinase domain-containing protein n=1 Tax=Fictibacillus marinisediminis TaxID=2878389 RepID=A0A9X1XEM3_9BACL|nr:hypothetical protein [Fictibacillus marinisediminis]